MRKSDEPGMAGLLLHKRTHDLRERVKELACLYSISDITERRNVNLGEMLQAVAEVLPPSWQHPEITCGRIVFEDREYTTADFRETEWRIAAEIILDGTRQGSVEVFYVEERPELEEGPFLKEERQLVDDIAIRLGRVIEQRRHDEMLRVSEERYRNLVERLADAVLIIDDNLISFVNAAMLVLVGARHKDEIIGHDFLEIIHADSRDLWTDTIQNQEEPDTWSPPIEIKLIRPHDHHVAVVEASAIRTGFGAENQFQLVLRDIRERSQAEARKLFNRLSMRERQIMEMVVQGETSKVIAIHLGISSRTVENHRAHLIRKMETHSLADLIHKAYMLGIR